MFQHTQLPFRRFKSYFPVVTGILAIQTLLFLLMTISGGSTNPVVLLRFGALENTLLAQGEWWRLATPVFLHIGITHFLFNSFSLYLLGPQLEWLFGRLRFIILYLLTGIMGNLATVYLGEVGISAGASGAIYGLLGVYVYLFWFRRGSMDPETGKGLLALVAINLVISLLTPTINLMAHLGGLVAGFLLAGPLIRRKM
ncbi:rhomboid family intramembrane serine protease [Kroppenstedtia guangzhouensis]|uniref:Rhomboid family intramembrane serine protease n=1 Tax=Kroppenstedtia guangzhouensis TaxID=1274356 RepID=A0ABQ1G7G1_9BACL|nr:rhomboid family intramembrane serine protease [Kroppenstedtia guangzhouensis]GGA38228.1 rhomboid family intramembrane serine protease [Kroppenstedtia guangzhouensis]